MHIIDEYQHQANILQLTQFTIILTFYLSQLVYRFSNTVSSLWSIAKDNYYIIIIIIINEKI